MGVDAAEIAAWFPARLRELRGAAGLTRPELSAASGVPLRTIEGYEQGRSAPTWEAVVRLAAGVGVGVGGFLVRPAEKSSEGA